MTFLFRTFALPVGLTPNPGLKPQRNRVLMVSNLKVGLGKPAPAKALDNYLLKTTASVLADVTVQTLF